MLLQSEYVEIYRHHKRDAEGYRHQGMGTLLYQNQNHPVYHICLYIETIPLLIDKFMSKKGNCVKKASYDMMCSEIFEGLTCYCIYWLQNLPYPTLTLH